MTQIVGHPLDLVREAHYKLFELCSVVFASQLLSDYIGLHQALLHLLFDNVKSDALTLINLPLSAPRIVLCESLGGYFLHSIFEVANILL